MYIDINEKLRIANELDTAINTIESGKMRDLIKALIYSGDDRVLMTKYYYSYPEHRPADWVDVWK